MKYILNEDYRLRGWTDSIANAEQISTRKLTKLTPHECLFLMRCDGKREADTEGFAPEIRKFLELGMIRETEGAELLPGQEYEMYENRFFRGIYLSITGGCDFRCKHCFSASDDRPRGLMPKTEDLLDLIRRLDECGIARVWISGGEPLLHQGFPEITEEMRKRGMILETLITNLHHMTPETADRLLAQGHRPLLHVSFDGLGTHEWLRGVPGSEQRALERIRMVKEKGFPVEIHCCVWKDSLPALRPTVRKMEELGVDCFRVTCVEPAPRWVAAHKDQTIPDREWLDFVCEFLDWWYTEKIGMDLDVWCFWAHRKGSGRVHIIPDVYEFRDRQHKVPICPDAYDRPYIDCDGRILLCIGISGFTSLHGMEWGNVYRDDLHTLLREGPFMDLLRTTLGELKDEDESCRACEWKDRCGYGCRAEALGRGRGLRGKDDRMCLFFRGGYYDRFREIAKRHGLEC